jgi:hypothetical protein
MLDRMLKVVGEGDDIGKVDFSYAILDRIFMSKIHHMPSRISHA